MEIIPQILGQVPHGVLRLIVEVMIVEVLSPRSSYGSGLVEPVDDGQEKVFCLVSGSHGQGVASIHDVAVGTV
ncbi:hypothetical protein EVJ50_01950 [Synechococcus sp. RSCCF101]|uniref:hypothetical protein n=1 Tax=Synechococcus sp. RSCCF101 TaxID=2511069 RepID=UPI0012446B16|nr:hypothetical protein [Synechococcus sp. RSCCF101]QEY31195.1 hypothetical protein EVJ50_01950 [Synechococcus sp. RSCCF101]